jgi:RimJ/RimL family protein N-acetyltransferase
MSEPASRFWPFFDLVVRTPGLELRYATDALLEELAVLHAAGVLRPGTEPFDGDATFYDPGPGTLRWLKGQWSARSKTAPEWWVLMFAVVVDGRAVGGQEMTGVEFAKTRTVNTFSWLGRDFQGRGLGKEMRAAALHLAFDSLGAERAESDCFDDNGPSRGVSLALGYEENGSASWPRPSGGAPATRYLLTRDRWELAGRRQDVTVEGVEACLPLLGLGPE